VATLVVFEFPSVGPWGHEMAEGYRDLAADIAAEPHLVWKVWTESSTRGVAGGVYLFETQEAARAYTAKHAARLRAWGVTDIDVREFEVNSVLSELTRA
jgi:hypothetical protein